MSDKFFGSMAAAARPRTSFRCDSTWTAAWIRIACAEPWIWCWTGIRPCGPPIAAVVA